MTATLTKFDLVSGVDLWNPDVTRPASSRIKGVACFAALARFIWILQIQNTPSRASGIAYEFYNCHGHLSASKIRLLGRSFIICRWSHHIDAGSQRCQDHCDDTGRKCLAPQGALYWRHRAGKRASACPDGRPPAAVTDRSWQVFGLVTSPGLAGIDNSQADSASSIPVTRSTTKDVGG